MTCQLLVFTFFSNLQEAIVNSHCMALLQVNGISGLCVAGHDVGQDCIIGRTDGKGTDVHDASVGVFSWPVCLYQACFLFFFSRDCLICQVLHGAFAH